VAILDVEGFRIAYDEHGQAVSTPKIVLLHAFPLSRLMWEPQIEEIRGVAHVVAPDMRGHGASDVAEGVTPLERMADDVDALVESLGLAPFVLVGLSMGGYVALAYMRKHAEKVRALVLADTQAGADTEEAKAGRYALIQEIADGGPAVVAEKMLPRLLSPSAAEKSPELVVAVRRMIETTSAAGMVGALAGMAERPDSTDLLPGIAVPTMIVVGSEDAVTPREKAEGMAAAIPGARLEVIEGAGHLSNFEQPAEFTRVLKDFLASLPTPTAPE
jgi:pimeloyl-ACP methyl ester carboxylesterase